MAASFDLLTGQLSVQPVLRAISNVGSLVVTQDGQVGFEQNYGAEAPPVETGDFLLTESGGRLLQENGGRLRLHSFVLMEDGGRLLQEDGGLVIL